MKMRLGRGPPLQALVRTAPTTVPANTPTTPIMATNMGSIGPDITNGQEPNYESASAPALSLVRGCVDRRE